jgi:integrase
MPKQVSNLKPSTVANAKGGASVHPVTGAQINPAKPYKLADGEGLFLLVKLNGKKLWRLKYRRPVTGTENLLSLGAFPVVGLQEARRKRREARELLAAGIDPGEARKAESAAKAEKVTAAQNTFEAAARDWMAGQKVADVTQRKSRWILETFLFPEIGSLPLDAITPRVLLDALRKIEATGKLETAKRAKVKAGQVFRWAILESRAEIDPTGSLRRALTPPKAKHHATITDPGKIGELLRAIEGFSGQPWTLAALRLAPLVFVRPGELRQAEWAEIDLDGAVWRIPGHKMKMGAAHIVPLSSQAVAILRELYSLTGDGRYLFPSQRTSVRPMSENTLNAALRRMGYSTEEMTAHGFRAMAATRLNEMGWNPDAIERQLAHAESNKVRAAYTHAAQYLDERRKMMQAWADYLDGLRVGGDVVAFRRKAS